MMRPVGVIILAAGKGTRMRSRLPKVAHQVAGRSMLEHALRAASAAVSSPAATDAEAPADDGSDHSPRNGTRFIVVIGHEADVVRAAVRWSPPAGGLTYITQDEQLGTGHAVRVAQDAATHAEPDQPAPETILVSYGDTPLVRPETLRSLLEEHHRTAATLTFLTGMTDAPNDYGRVTRDAAGRVRGIVEVKHATPEELAIAEVNSGIYVFQADWLWSRLDALEPHPNGEYYLTDLVEIAVHEGREVATHAVALEETMGVNNRVALAEAERVLRERLLRDLMLSGVTVQDPATTYIEAGVRVGEDTIIRPGCHLLGATVIGAGCDIGPNSVIRDSQIGDDCQAQASWVEEAVMESGSRIGPMSHLRPGARLLRSANLGNFAEVKNSVIGEGVQMHHFSYMGDATVGAHTNVGAGTITMNYDGKNKHHTEIGAGVFLGCDSLLRAPVTIGDGATTGGGSVVTRNVAPGTLVVGMPARVARRVRSVASDVGTAPSQQQPADTASDMRSGAASSDATTDHQPPTKEDAGRTEEPESTGGHLREPRPPSGMERE